MANRSYLYALSNQPESYADRPETITGLSEWPYAVPFAYYLLLSGNPRLCASLVSDGFDGEDPEAKTPLYALTGEFAAGFARLERFAAVLRRASGGSELMLESLAEASDFLKAHKDRYFLLETVELDTMRTADAAALKTAAESHLAAARAAGAAVDALSSFGFLATRQLRKAVSAGSGKFAPFKGLSLSDEFDHRDTEQPLGIGFWTTVLYFALSNRQDFEARRRES